MSNCKLFLFLNSLAILFVFHQCNGNAINSRLPQNRLSYLKVGRGGVDKSLGKRSTDLQVEDPGNEYDYLNQEVEEPQCDDGMFYHIRALRCVPLFCPGGNSYRDRPTGECILKSHGSSSNSDTEPRVGRFLNRMKPVNKFRLPFGLTLKG